MLGFLGRWAGSKGMVKVPNLIGLSKQEAIDVLTAAGLINSVNTETETSNSSLDGKAHQQSKNADELVDYETEIEFSHYKYVAAPVAPVASPTAPVAAPNAPYSPPNAPVVQPMAPVYVPTTGTVYMTYCYAGTAYSDTFTVDENNIIVQDINQACAAYSSLFTGMEASQFSCSTSSMPALPTNCAPAPTAPVVAPTAPVAAPTAVWYCTMRDADCSTFTYESDRDEHQYDPCVRCSKTSYPTAAACSGCGTVPIAPTAPEVAPTAPTAPVVAPTASVTWYCTTSVQCGGAGNCGYSTSSTNVSASGTGYSTQCLTSGYGSCQSTTCSSPTAPTAPVAAPTAPVAAPTAPVAAPTAPVAAPTAPVAAPVAAPEAPTPVFGGCIFEDTLVSAVDENDQTVYVPAKNIEVGMRVWGATFDESVDESIQNPYGWSSETITNMQKVATLIANITPKTVAATMTINNNSNQKFSLEQGIFTKRDGIYTYRTTADLIVGDTVLTFKEDLNIFVETLVESIEIQDGPANVYKFDAEPTDTLIAGGLLVHNRKVY